MHTSHTHFSYTHTHTHTLSLSLSPTPTHAHTLTFTHSLPLTHTTTNLPPLFLQGADPDAEAADGTTAIFEAVKGGHLQCMEILRGHGADPLKSVAYGATPLHTAASNGHAACVSALLAWGADIDGLTSEGCTALHYAAYMGRPQVVELLLEQGCDPLARSVRSPWSLKHSNHSLLAVDYARGSYSCSDPDCVCQLQVSDAQSKKQCEIILTKWASGPRSLALRSRAAIRRAVRQKHLPPMDKLGLPNVLHDFLELKEERRLCQKALADLSPAAAAADMPLFRTTGALSAGHVHNFPTAQPS